MADPVRTAYLVSRFPSPSETFILRELNGVAADPRIELVGLASMFPPLIDFVHPDAERWLDTVHRPGLAEGLLALLGWFLRRPIRTTSSLARLIGACAGSLPRLARSLASVPAAAAIARRFQKQRVEHVHAHFATYPALGAWLAHRLTGSRYSLTPHAHDIFVDRRLLDLTFGEASFVVTISDFNRDFLAQLEADTGTPLEEVRYGLDLDLYPFKPRAAPSGGPIRALCIAGLQEYKGHRFLIEALARSSAPGLERIELDLVGDGPLRNELDRQVAATQLNGRVRFHGVRNEVEVRQHLAEADIFVLPSIIARDGQMEGLPVALIEATASGLPIVTTNISGIPELVHHDETGIVVEPSDPAALADALSRLASGAAGLNLEAGRRQVESQHDLRQSVSRMAELIAAGTAQPV